MHDRAKLILSREYQALLRRGIPFDLATQLKRLEYLRTFVRVDRGVVAVGAAWKEVLFIAFRGTAGLHDLIMDIRAPMVEVVSPPEIRPTFKR